MTTSRALRTAGTGAPARRQRRPRQLQVVGAVVYEPRDAAGDDQLGNADHRAPGPRAAACTRACWSWSG